MPLLITSLKLCIQNLKGWWPKQGNAPSSKWEDIQVRGGSWGNDGLMSSAVSNVFKCMIQRIGLPWTFQPAEASQDHECKDIPGERTMEDKMEMRNGLFRSLDPNAKS